MLATKKNIWVIFSCFVLFFSSCTYLYSNYAPNNRDEYIGHGEPNIIDILDYHNIATNFAFTNQFPISGFILDPALYKIKPNKEISMEYLDMFRENGPVTSFIRPPLYPLLVGCIYKIWGFKYFYNLRLNIFLLAIIIGLMPLVGYINWTGIGYISGVVGSLIFMKYAHDHWFLNTMDIEVFSSFILFLIFSCGLWAETKGRPINYMIWGVFIGLGLLVKPILMPLPIVVACFIIIKRKKGRCIFVLKKIAALILGIILIISPWTIYINHVKNNTIAQRTSWCQKVLAGMERPEISGIEDYTESCPQISKKGDARCERSVKIMTYIVKSLAVYHSRTTSFILITSAFGDALLNFNNEYCSDGGMHFEWMFIKTSFYRSYCSENQSVVTKLYLFFTHYPSFLFRIPMARFTRSFTEYYHKYYWLAAALWGLCAMQIPLFSISSRGIKFILTLVLLVLCVLVYLFSIDLNKYAAIALYTPLFCLGLFFFQIPYRNVLSVTFPVIWLSLFLFMFVIFPNPVYMLVSMPISCLCTIYFSILLTKGFSDLAFGTLVPSNP